MNILRVADEKSIPWFMTEEQKPSTPIEEVEEINVAEEVDDLVLAQECDRIESCSSNGKLYHYNSSWDEGTICHLREYAIACGMDLSKFRGFNPADIAKESDSDEIVKLASVEQLSDKDQTLKDLWEDPFHIEENSDMSHMEPANWEQVKKQETLDVPSLITGNVISIGGGENYFKNSDVNPAPNQNSITNPNAIKQLAESETLDNGERLKQEAKAKEEQKKANHSAWQQDKVSEMSGVDIIPKGTVFPTEMLNANTGLAHQPVQGGVMSGEHISLPDLTEGEKIAMQNAERKASIQRPKEQDDWQKPCKQSSRQISEGFVDALVDAMNKVKK
jgi:hypothetical protein